MGLYPEEKDPVPFDCRAVLDENRENNL